MKIYLKKTAPGRFECASEVDQEASESLPYGQELSCEVKRIRNYRFHKKYMSLLRLGFHYFQPMPYKDSIPEKNFESFREDVIISAGYYDVAGRPDGSVKLVAKSISFASMEESEFNQLYSKTIDVMLNLLGKFGFTEEELKRVERDVIHYDG